MSAMAIRGLAAWIAASDPHRSAIARRGERRATSLIIGYRRRLFASATACGGLVSPYSGRQGLAPSDSERIRLDQALMARIAAGDRDAFAGVARAYAPRLVRLARSILTASPAEAEEAVQEALLRLWRDAAKWQPVGRISTWLHQVTYRLCIDTLRRRRPSIALDPLDSEVEDAAPLPDAVMVQAEEADAIREALAHLSDRQRHAVILSHFQELSQADAAATMGIGEEAYESLLARARRRLRVLLEQDGEQGGGKR
jgi:RNA polymerase sigma-70 factor, ECF subfamily